MDVRPAETRRYTENRPEEVESVILAGDVGGTNTRLAGFEPGPDGLALAVERTYPSRHFAGLDEIVAAFVADHGLAVEHVCIGVAGPVRDGRCATTNLPWRLDERSLAARLGLRHATLINDLEATAFGIPLLAAGDLAVLQDGAPGAAGNAAIAAAGTGLGEAGLFWDGARHHPYATEGGHTDFAPRDDEQVELLRFLRGELGRVSWERVVSGPGLVNILRFLRDTGRAVEEPELAAAMAAGDPAAAIADAAQAGRSPLAARALGLFVRLYGAEAGNLALKTMATGGVYLGGGIPPKILPALADGFLPAFRDKGRMRPLMEAMPVRVVLDPRVALRGAARCAVLRAGLLA